MIRKSTNAFGTMVRRHTPHFRVRNSDVSPTGIDHLLARHISHLFIRDPIVIFSEMKDQDDEHSMDHFEVPPGNAAINFRY